MMKEWDTRGMLQNLHSSDPFTQKEVERKINTLLQNPANLFSVLNTAQSFYQARPHLLTPDARGCVGASSLNPLRKEDMPQFKKAPDTFKNPDLLKKHRTVSKEDRFKTAQAKDYASLMRRKKEEAKKASSLGSSSAPYNLPNPILDQAVAGAVRQIKGEPKPAKSFSGSSWLKDTQDFDPAAPVPILQEIKSHLHRGIDVVEETQQRLGIYPTTTASLHPSAPPAAMRVVVDALIPETQGEVIMTGIGGMLNASAKGVVYGATALAKTLKQGEKAIEEAVNFTRKLTIEDLGLKKASVQELKGTFSLQGKIATVKIDMIEATNPNLLGAINNLKNTAVSAGAETLRIEGTLANIELSQVLSKRYTIITEGSVDYVSIPLQGISGK